MNFTTCLVFTIAVSAVSFLPAVEEGKDIPLEAPEGWKGETSSRPPGFAPGMKLQGLEKIRFAPGMFKPESESFFSYAFVFRLGPKQDLSLKTVESEILVYYRGLAKAVGGEGIQALLRSPPRNIEPFYFCRSNNSIKNQLKKILLQGWLELPTFAFLCQY